MFMSMHSATKTFSGWHTFPAAASSSRIVVPDEAGWLLLLTAFARLAAAAAAASAAAAAAAWCWAAAAAMMLGPQMLSGAAMPRHLCTSQVKEACLPSSPAIHNPISYVAPRRDRPP